MHREDGPAAYQLLGRRRQEADDAGRAVGSVPAVDPALRFAGKNPNQAELDLIRQRLGLDQAWYVQFLKFIKRFFTGDQYGWPGLGYTFAGQSSVLHLIVQRAPRTILLIMGAAMRCLTA